MKYTGYYWMTAENTIGWHRAAGWYSCPATENKTTAEEATAAAKKFGNKIMVKACKEKYV